MAVTFSDDIFKRIFLNGNIWISIQFSLEFVRKGAIDNIPALVQIMPLNRRQAIIWTNAYAIDWRIYATLGGGGELNMKTLNAL